MDTYEGNSMSVADVLKILVKDWQCHKAEYGAKQEWRGAM